MSELTSRFIPLQQAVGDMSTALQAQNETIISLLTDVRGQLGYDGGVTLGDVRNSIESLSDRMATLLEAVKNDLEIANINWETSNANDAANVRYLLAGMIAASCCETTLALPVDATPDGNSCARAGWLQYHMGLIAGELKAILDGGTWLNATYVRGVFATHFPSDAISYNLPDSIAAGIAGAFNTVTTSELSDLVAEFNGFMGAAIRNSIANASSPEEAHTVLMVATSGYSHSDDGRNVISRFFNTSVIADAYVSSIDFSGYDNSICAPEITIPECTGTASIFTRTLDGATPLPFGSWGGGSRSVFYSCPTLDLSFDIDVLNHDDSDSLVATVHQGEAFTSDSDVNYYFRPHDGTTTGEHEFTTCGTLLG